MTEHEIVARVYGAKENSMVADELIEDYLPFILSETSKFTGGSAKLGEDDEVSIAMIAFHQAIESYDKKRGTFLGFAATVIKNRLIDYARKESRHQQIISLDSPSTQRENSGSLLDTIAEEDNQYLHLDYRSATLEEIKTLVAELEGFGLSLTDIADNSPKQERTLEACQQAVSFCLQHPDIVENIRETGRLPLSRIVKETDLPRKTLERHRRYLLTLLLIYSNGYAIIRGHLKQVFVRVKGGQTV